MISKTFISRLAIFCFCIHFTSCISYGDATSTCYNGESDTNSEKSSSFEVYYDCDFVYKTYRRMGDISVVGDRLDGKEDVLNRLKYECWNSGANGVINVVIGTETRKAGFLGSDDPVYYEALTMEGTAVSFSEVKTNSESEDMSFIEKSKADEHDDSSQSAVMTILATITGGVVGLIELFKGDEE